MSSPTAESSSVRDLEARLAQAREHLARLRAAVSARFLGQSEAVDLLLYALLADGHVLLEGAPGLGKTTLCKTLARSLDLAFQRIQFTPDLMPSDILGTRILEETPAGGHAFRFERGPIFAQVLLADEINRATPRTQSALLEAMQERQVTVFGETLRLPEPFLVVATQNPIEMEGTYPLPEAQLDRFLCKIELRAPSEDELVAILQATGATPAPVEGPVFSAAEIAGLRELVRSVPASSDILRLVARMVRATDPSRTEAREAIRGALRYGASPRGGQALLALARARALALGRPYVASEDVLEVAAPALRHRLVLGYEGAASGVSPDALVAEAVAAASASRPDSSPR
jgi:MoxR-like ATPase